MKRFFIYASCLVVLLLNSSVAMALSNKTGTDPSGKSQR